MSSLVYSKLKFKDIVEVGSDKSISLGEIANIVNSKSIFQGNKFNLLSKNYCKKAKLEVFIKQIKYF